MITVLGGYQTKFGELWGKSLEDLIVEAGLGAIKKSRIAKEEIELVIVGNKLGGRIEGQDHLGSLASEILGLQAGGIRVEAACASGGVAIHQGFQAIKSGVAKTVLVIGVEKMTDKKNGEIAKMLMGAASNEERRAGLSFPGLYGLIARRYLGRYQATKRDLARVAVKNHHWGTMNKKAQFQREITIKQVMTAPMVASPLGLLDCSPITDGAAAIVLGARKKGKVELVTSMLASNSVGLCQRDNLLELTVTRKASQRAYCEAKVAPDEIDVAEVHDCFTIAEVLALEDLSFCKKGTGWRGVKIPINTSGGLKACGHPVGATGVKQVLEIFRQLAGQAGVRQIPGAKLGLAHNVGGSGGTAVVSILRKR